MPKTDYSAIFNQIDDLLDPKLLVPHLDGSKLFISKAVWDDFNTWCDAIHVDCDPTDPEIANYDREI